MKCDHCGRVVSLDEDAAPESIVEHDLESGLARASAIWACSSFSLVLVSEPSPEEAVPVGFAVPWARKISDFNNVKLSQPLHSD